MQRSLKSGTVEAVNLDQGFWGTFFNFARVEVHGTGDDTWLTPIIANPLGFRRELEQALTHTAARP
jgi:hypothetical protein